MTSINKLIPLKIILPFLIIILYPVFGGYLWAQTEQKYDYYRTIQTRDVFKPLWNVVSDDEVERKLRENSLQNEEKKRKEEEQARLDELKKREEESALQMKKSEIENTVVLSGIVFFGGQNRALLEDRRGRGGSSMYAVGDSVRDMKVESIDDTKKEVVLDYKGKLKITLRLSK